MNICLNDTPREHLVKSTCLTNIADLSCCNLFNSLAVFMSHASTVMLDLFFVVFHETDNAANRSNLYINTFC